MDKIISLICEMSPYLLLGFLLAGVLHAFVPRRLYSKYLSRPNLKSVLLAALVGVPLPLCSCGVIPAAMSLRREGASKGATTSFLIATPQTGVDSIIATYSLMGLPFAIVRPIAALVTAIFGGALVNAVGEVRAENLDLRAGDSEGEAESAEPRVDRKAQKETEDAQEGLGFGAKVVEALRYAFLDMMSDIGKWLALGLLVAGLITICVPDSFFAIFRDNSLASMLLVLCIAIPMYVCATGSIPVAVALMMKGLTPGAGLVLLMAGPACNMASMLVISKVMGRRTLLTYLASIVAGAIGFGLLIDHALPRDWFVSALVARDACCVHHHSLFAIGCSILLGLLLVNALVRQKLNGRKFEKVVGKSEEASCNQEEMASNTHAEATEITENTHTTMKQTITINGMNCNHCRAAAEKAILAVPGVTTATVDLSSKLAVVEGNIEFDALRAAVESCGFSAERA